MEKTFPEMTKAELKTFIAGLGGAHGLGKMSHGDLIDKAIELDNAAVAVKRAEAARAAGHEDDGQEFEPSIQVPTAEVVDKLCEDIQAAAAEEAREALEAEVNALANKPVFEKVAPTPTPTPSPAPVNPDAKRSVEVTYAEGDKVKHAKFGTVEAAEKWATKAIIAGTVTEVAINGADFELEEVSASV